MLLTVGRVLRPHGVRGEVVVEVRTDEPEQRFATGSRLSTEPPPADGEPLQVVSQRPHQGRLIVTFEGVHDRGDAERLRGLWLQIDSETVAPLADPDEFHDHQLIGLAVVTVDEQQVGELTRVDHVPGADLLVVRRIDGRTTLVPFVMAIVPEVDLAAGKVVIDPPPGLLDL